MRAVRLLLVLAAAALLAGGCGAKEDSTGTVEKRPRPAEKLREFSVTLDGYAGAETMGIAMAEENGYFEDAGLEVSLSAPLNPVRPVNYVEKQIVDLAVSYEPQVVLARERGSPAMAVGSLVSRPTMAMIWLKKSGVDGVADLRGKTIAFPGPSFQKELLRAVLSRAGLSLADVKLKRVDYELVPALVSGRADAIFGGSWNVEGVELEERGLGPEVVRVQGLGVPAYDELVLIAHRERLRRDPESIRGFMSALARGVAAAEDDPRAAAEAVLAISERTDRKVAKAQVEATIPLLSKTARVNPERVARLVTWMRDEGLIAKSLSLAGLFTSRYLSGPRPLEVTLDGEPNPQNAGILLADRKGYFEEAGLEVSLYVPETPRRPIPYVLRRWVDLSISHEPQIELAQEKGFPIVAVESLISEPTAALIWLGKSRIDGIADLRGKTIAIPGLSFQRDFLRRILGRAGLRLADVKVAVAEHDLVPALVSGRADAIFGGSWNVEGRELAARGLKPVVTRVQDLGIPPYDELVFVARRDRLAVDPGSIRAFLAAVARGTEAAVEDPSAAAEAIEEFYSVAETKVSMGAVEATLPLLSPKAAAP